MVNDLRSFVSNNKIGILLAGVYIFLSQLIFSYISPTMWLFGVPCPACGMTRAGLSLLRLDFSAAFAYNPGIFLVPFGVYAYAKNKLWLFALVVFALVAIFVIRLFTSFGTEPLVINRSALLFRIIELF